MAMSGYINSGADSYGGYFRLSWSAKHDAPNNRSLISWNVKFYTGGANRYTNAVQVNSAKIGTKTVMGAKKFSNLDKETWYTLGSGSFYASHTSSGTLSLALYVSGWTTASGTKTGSGTAVVNTIPRYSITTSATTGGTITPSITGLSSGSTRIITITPNEGYVIDQVFVNSVNKGAVSSVSVTVTSASATVSAYFRKITFPITITHNDGGDATDSQEIGWGENFEISFVPFERYKVGEVFVDDISQGAITEYLFENVLEPHTVNVIFKRNVEFSINGQQGAGIRVNNKEVIGMMVNGKIIF